MHAIWQFLKFVLPALLIRLRKLSEYVWQIVPQNLIGSLELFQKHLVKWQKITDFNPSSYPRHERLQQKTLIPIAQATFVYLWHKFRHHATHLHPQHGWQPWFLDATRTSPWPDLPMPWSFLTWKNGITKHICPKEQCSWIGTIWCTWAAFHEQQRIGHKLQH